MKTRYPASFSPETIALYERLERERYPGFNPKNPAHWLLGIAVWPAVFMRFPRFFLVLLFSGLLVGATQAWKSPAVLTGLALSPAVLALNSTSSRKKAAGQQPLLSGTVLPVYRR